MERQVELPDGTTLVVRPMRESDLPAVHALYRSLSPDDLHRRFFTAAPPPSGFLERWFKRTSETGVGLVAVASHPGSGPQSPSEPGSPGETQSTGATESPSETVVAEAGYVLLADGSGELAITVDPTWRGWLGHFVLDALVEAAAERGVECLHADVLMGNRQMLSLLDARGYATVDHPDWNTVRVVIGTGGRVPPWPGPHDRPRVLVEVSGGRWHAEAAATLAGYQVLSCPGPRPGPGGRCPLLDGERCELADGADVVVMSLAVDGPGEAILDAHRAQNPETPVCVSSLRPADLEAAAGRADEVVRTSRDLALLLDTLARLTGGGPDSA